MSQYSSTVQGLRAFLTDRAGAADWTLLNVVFADKSGSILPERVGNISEDEEAVLEMKQDKAENKNLMAKKMRALYP